MKDISKDKAVIQDSVRTMLSNNGKRNTPLLIYLKMTKTFTNVVHSVGVLVNISRPSDATS